MNLPKKMKAVVTYGPGDYRYEEVEVPKAGNEEIIIKVEACGICAGDIKAYLGGETFWGGNGKAPYLEVPAIGGHEFVGSIVSIGPGVEEKPDFGTGDRSFIIGDRVTAEQIVPCGECMYCRTNRYWLCKKHDVFGFKSYLNGGFAEYVKCPANAILYKVPDSIPLESAVLVEPFSCSMHAIDRAKITSDDIVVISGAGPLGLGMITAAKIKKPKKLIVLDLQDGRLKKALEFGCDIALNPSKEDIYSAIKGLTDGYGCDIYIEATGHTSGVTQGLELIRKGGRFVEFSVFSSQVSCNWSIVGDEKELEIMGVSLSPFCFPKVIQGISKGELNTEGIVTKFPLSQFKDAFDLCKKGNASIKVVLIPD